MGHFMEASLWRYNRSATAEGENNFSALAQCSTKPNPIRFRHATPGICRNGCWCPDVCVPISYGLVEFDPPRRVVGDHVRGCTAMRHFLACCQVDINRLLDTTQLGWGESQNLIRNEKAHDPIVMRYFGGLYSHELHTHFFTLTST
jgi:hypothetical protein